MTAGAASRPFALPGMTSFGPSCTVIAPFPHCRLDQPPLSSRPSGAPEPPCPPYEDTYRKGLEKTVILLAVSEFYKHFDLKMDPGEGKRKLADHVSAELEFRHFLTFKEAQARKRPRPEKNRLQSSSLEPVWSSSSSQVLLSKFSCMPSSLASPHLSDQWPCPPAGFRCRH